MSTTLSDFTLITIAGPTASGKTATAIAVARRLNCHIISADSRQVYRSMPIGTAAPTPDELRAAPHHFVGILDPTDYFSAAEFEEKVLGLIPELARESRWAVMCGGSMMYVDAVTRGIDELPTISDDIRAEVGNLYLRGGIDAVREELQRLDPTYYGEVDVDNPRRLIHAIEICRQAGRPYSELRTGRIKERPFRQKLFALTLPREQMFDRINRRVDAMIDAGLEEEARRLLPLRGCNSLNTVGYKELFACFDGTMERATAIARIKKNTRVYAKKQLTWLKKRPEFTLIDAGNNAAEKILEKLDQKL